MYTMHSLGSTLVLTMALAALMGINFHWHYTQPSSRHRSWFHAGSVMLSLFLIFRLFLISLLGLWRHPFYEQGGWVALGVGLVAYAMAVKTHGVPGAGQAQAPPSPLPLEPLFGAMEDKVYIYDSDFQLTGLGEGADSPLEKGSLGHLRKFLHQMASDIPQDQGDLLESFFQHQQPHQPLAQFQWLSHRLKSYVVLSKVLDARGDWLGTVMLMHQAEEELALMTSMEAQNQQRLDMNRQLEASLHKLAKYGYEEEKDRLLQEINESMVKGTHQSIRAIQAIEKEEGLTVEAKQQAIGRISQQVSEVYKHLRQTVRQMAAENQGEHHD